MSMKRHYPPVVPERLEVVHRVRIYGGEQKLRSYHAKRNANWISRGSPGPPEAWPAMGCTVLPITPKEAELQSALGRVKLGRLKILNISARNWRVFDSPNLKLRISEKSQSARPGPSEYFVPRFRRCKGQAGRTRPDLSTG